MAHTYHWTRRNLPAASWWLLQKHNIEQFGHVRNAEAPKVCQKHWTSPKGKQTLPWKKHFYNSLRSQDSFAAGQHYATQHQTGATFKVIAQGAGLSRPIRQQSSRRKMAVKKCSVTSKKVGKKLRDVQQASWWDLVISSTNCFIYIVAF